MLKDAAAHRRLLREWLVAGGLGIVLALVAGTALRTFVLGAVVVPSRSMCDTVIPGDRVLVSKLVVPRLVSFGLPFTDARCEFTIPPIRPIRVGDVIVVRPPDGWIENPLDRTAFLVKRCAGMPGDTLVFDHDVLTVNGFVLRLPALAIQRKHPRVYHDDGAADSVIVPAGEYFLLGDNPGESVDSRVRGTVPASSVVGIAAMVYWSVGPAMSEDGERGVRWDRIGRVVR
jgi:signal peptidase I